MISEKGTLKETSPIKLLITVFEYDLTGILYLKQDDILKVLYFNRGKLIWAISNSTEDKLENILLAEGVIDSNAIIKVRNELNMSESIGKVLVEKGIITLEELIDSTKKQLKSIILSVLKWDNGGFQFVKDAPPERLLSLDLNIIDFIVNYILEDLDVSYIWKEIGSLQVELVKNQDPAKVQKFSLTNDQKQLFDSFDGEKKLEEVLSLYGGINRDSQLKLVYFFLIAEILVKKEFDLSNSPFMTKDVTLDKLEVEVSDPIAEVTADTDSSTDDYVFQGESQTSDPLQEQPAEEKPEPEFIDKDDLVPDPFPEPKIAEDPDPSFPINTKDEKSAITMVGEDKKKVRLFNYFFLFVIVIFVIAGIIFLMLSPGDDLEDVLSKEKKDQIAGILTSEQGNKVNSTVDQPLEVDMEPKKQDPPDKSQGTKTETLARDVPKTEPNVGAKPESEIKESVPEGKTALQYFKEGNFTVAADIWKKRIIDNRIRFAILLELDCEKKSVQRAFSEIRVKDNFFILTKKRRDRTCYLVLWGRYQSRQEAKSDLGNVPDFFWKQTHPPVVFELLNL